MKVRHLEAVGQGFGMAFIVIVPLLAIVIFLIGFPMYLLLYFARFIYKLFIPCSCSCHTYGYRNCSWCIKNGSTKKDN